MTILAIETSCDETAIALISCPPGEERPSIIDERIASQIKLHAEYGGVVPELAAREHLRALPILTNEILDAQAKFLSNEPLSALAVTTGPGLKGSLLMGVNFAKGFGLANQLPVFGVNHIEAHLLSPLMCYPELTFPYLGVIVSGGHTEILEVRGVGEYSLIERTLDDAAGEAFDKCAALLGIAYPGGAQLSKLAAIHVTKSNPYQVSASRAQLSYSGLKTSFRTLLDKLRRQNVSVHTEAACAAVETAIVDTLYARVDAALELTGLTRIGVSGGVAANQQVRRRLAELGSVFPTELRWCGDNAAMIGFVAALRALHELPAGDLETRARWPVEEMSRRVSDAS